MTRHYLARSAINPKLVLGASAIHGRGVLATAPIAKGETVMEFGGAAISRAEAFSGHYRVRSVWPVGVDRFIALPESDPGISLDEYLNHSCDANCWLADEVTLVAQRDIEAGEEITLDQGTWNFDDDYVDDGEPCSCGAANCRRVLSNRDWQRADLQTRYSGHFHPLLRHFQKRD
jgi:SET domain-containing protein